MKIVSWNANGKFVKNYRVILEEEPADIYIIPECTNPKISDSEDYVKLDSEYYWVDWVGDEEYPDHGLGMIAKKNVEIKVWDLDNKGLRYFIPVTVKDDFNLLAVWTKVDEGESNAEYPKLITEYYEEHKDSGFFNEDMIICGDFNCDKRVKNETHRKNVDEMMDKLSEIQLVDVYHDIYGENQGEESKATFYLYKHSDKPYHLDHVFAAKDKVDLHVDDDFDKWVKSKRSDHVPIILKI